MSELTNQSSSAHGSACATEAVPVVFTEQADIDFPTVANRHLAYSMNADSVMFWTPWHGKTQMQVNNLLVTGPTHFSDMVYPVLLVGQLVTSGSPVTPTVMVPGTAQLTEEVDSVRVSSVTMSVPGRPKFDVTVTLPETTVAHEKNPPKLWRQGPGTKSARIYTPSCHDDSSCEKFNNLISNWYKGTGQSTA